MNKMLLFSLVAVLVILFSVVECAQDDDDDGPAIFGLDITFDESDVGVDTPDGWVFLFAINLSDDEAELIDEGFSIDISLLQEFVDLEDIEQMIAMAKVESLNGYGDRLRYANKLVVKDQKLQLDTETLDQLGDSIGSSGEGLYVAYFAENQNGYISGKLVDCDGETPLPGALAIITGGPFFTFTASDGTYALPTLSGVPAAVSLNAGNCVCTAAAPSTDTAENPNPKSDDAADTPPSDNFSDDTDNVDAGICVCCPPNDVDDDDDDTADDDTADDDTADDDTADDDTADDDTADDDTADDDTADDDTADDDTADDDTADDDTADDDTADDDDDDDVAPFDIDFEDGSLAGWQYTSDCAIYGVSGDAYDELFPAGGESQYLYVSSGGLLVPSCTLTLSAGVPSGATELEISYNFVSQEYQEWVGSVYNDIFTVLVQGSPDYLVNRTVNNIATDKDWLNIATDADAATISEIATSADAQYNPTYTEPHSNGPYKFDGMLDWNNDASDNPRGEPEDNTVGKTATVALPDGFSTVTIIVTVSDVGDKIYDSVGLIDWLDFK